MLLCIFLVYALDSYIQMGSTCERATIMSINEQEQQRMALVHGEFLIPNQTLEASLVGGVALTVDSEQDIALASRERVRIIDSIDAKD